MDYFPWIHEVVNGNVGKSETAKKNGTVNGNPHVEHCAGCFRSQCAFGERSVLGKNGTSSRDCPVVICGRCDVRMHRCKLDEHLEHLCAEVVVTCINAGNGCDMHLKRKALGKHLEECPASVVFCSVEWNRWPLHYTDKHCPLPFILPNPHGHPTQLDMALALRDQSALNHAYSLPRHFRRLRNELTERFPAVPLPRHRPVPAGLLQERGTVNEVSREGSAESEEEWSWSDAPWRRREHPPGLSRSLCRQLVPAARHTAETLKVALQMITERTDGMEEEDSLHDVDSVDADEDTGADSTEKTSAEISAMTDCVISSAEPPVAGNVPVPAAPPLHYPVALGLNLTVETITRYQTKPKSMLTFVCGQSFRRSEYAAHYRNVHSEIQGGLTWMEQRCPLAQYGCPYSLRRIHPLQPLARIIHSPDLQSFGLQRVQEELQDDGNVDYLSALPEEIVQHIASKLDGYSLNCFSRVSRRLRQLCVGLLERHGMVQQEWIRTASKQWRVGFQRWTFSTGFDEVSRWAILPLSTGQHLLHCPFYRRLRHVHPVHLPLAGNAKKVDPLLIDRLHAAADRHVPSACEEVVVPDLHRYPANGGDNSVAGDLTVI